jgi:hypothetical protein
MNAARKKPGLYANIHAKQERIAHGSGEKMRKPDSAGAPSDAAFAAAAKTTRAAEAKKAAAKKAARKRATARKRV